MEAIEKRKIKLEIAESGFILPIGDHPEILEALRVVAKSDFRSPEMQVLYILERVLIGGDKKEKKDV